MYYAIGASVSSLHRESTDSPILGSYRLLTLGAHAQEGYGTCPVCLFVCLLPLNRGHGSFLLSTQGTCGTLLGFSSFLTRGFSKKPSVQSYAVEKPICK